MRRPLITFALLAGLTGLAHSQESFDSILIPCEKAPIEAVKGDLPRQLSQWATLSCTRYGQVLRAAKGWVWHNPKANSFVRIWSQPSEQELEESAQNNYFKALTFRQLSQEEAEAANALLASELGAKPQKVADAYTLEVADARGGKQVVNFIRAEANVRLGTFWGWACASPCTKPEVFMGFSPK
jgi:hypothetical protein